MYEDWKADPHPPRNSHVIQIHTNIETTVEMDGYTTVSSLPRHGTTNLSFNKDQKSSSEA